MRLTASTTAFWAVVPRCLLFGYRAHLNYFMRNIWVETVKGRLPLLTPLGEFRVSFSPQWRRCQIEEIRSSWANARSRDCVCTHVYPWDVYRLVEACQQVVGTENWISETDLFGFWRLTTLACVWRSEGNIGYWSLLSTLFRDGLLFVCLAMNRFLLFSNICRLQNILWSIINSLFENQNAHKVCTYLGKYIQNSSNIWFLVGKNADLWHFCLCFYIYFQHFLIKQNLVCNKK